MVITAPPEREPKKVDGQGERPSHILTLSAKSEAALIALSARMEEFLAQNKNISLADVTYTANTGRATFAHRLAVVAGSTEEAVTQLMKFSAGEETNGVSSGHAAHNKRLKIAFLFTGQGAQYHSMGQQLYETQPVFREA